MKGTKFFGIRIALAACVLALLLAVEAGVSIALTAKPEPGAKYCVTFEKAVKKAAKDAIKARFGNVIREELKLVDVALVVLPSESQAGELAKIPGVKRVVPDKIIIDFAGKPSGEELPWGVDRIDADMVWDTNTGAGIKVAVLDTGIEKTHPDLMANIKGGINTVGSEPPENYDDIHGHGTRIAGVIAAVDNDVGVIGIGPEIELYAVRFRETLYMIPQLGSTIDLCEGMEWCLLGPDGQPATGDEMQVINMSFSVWSVWYDEEGNPQKGEPLHDLTFYSLVQQAYAAGIVQVAAVTNDSEWVDELHDPDNPPEDLSLYRFPASYPQVIGASATGMRTGGNPSQRGDYFTSFSNYGPVVDLAAPGISIETTDIGGVYTTGGGGTSYAAPHVVGAAALVLKQFGPQSPDWVRTRLMDTAEWLDNLTAEEQGAGLVDAEMAVQTIDTTPPAAVADLTTSNPNSNSIDLSWPAPGDDGNEGTASQYDIRYSASAITDTNWETATQCNGEPSPSSAGTSESFTVTGLSPNTTYHFALKTADEIPNWSELSNSPSGTTQEGTVQTMHVSAIGMSLKETGPNVSGIATVTIVDASDVTVSGVTVYGYWSGATSDTDSGTTDASGQVSLNSDKLKNPAPGTTFTFTVDDVVKAGWTYDPSANVENSDSISTPPAAPAAYTTGLGNAFPSPANPETWIPFTLSKAEYVVIRIYNVTGRLVRTLNLGQKTDGAYVSKEKAAYWDGRNATGEKVSSGVYFYLMEAGSFRGAKKMLIVR